MNSYQELKEILKEHDFIRFKQFLLFKKTSSLIWLWNYIAEDDTRVYKNNINGMLTLCKDYALDVYKLIISLTSGCYFSTDTIISINSDDTSCVIVSHIGIQSFLKDRLLFIFNYFKNNIEYLDLFVKGMERHAND